MVAAYGSTAVRAAGVTGVALDLRSDDAIGVVAGCSPDLVIHAAAATDIDRCEREPEWARAVNVEGTGRVARAAVAAGAKLVVISTDSVFSGEGRRWRESDPPAPQNVYARSKLDAERLALEIAPDALVARTVIYGWNAQSKTSLAEWALQRLEAGQRVPGFSDAFFSPMLANDLGDALVELVPPGTHAASCTSPVRSASASTCSPARSPLPSLSTATSSTPSPSTSAGFTARRPRDTSLDCRLAALAGPEAARPRTKGSRASPPCEILHSSIA